jgi:hypothetical protein
MKAPIRIGRRGRSLAAALALGAALGAAACGGKGQVPAAEYDPDVPAKDAPPPPAPEPAPPAPGAAPGAAPAAVLTPEHDSIQEARAFALRKASMETYESCMAKVNAADEPARPTLRAACERSRGAPR